jgi:hypothetical protein
VALIGLSSLSTLSKARRMQTPEAASAAAGHGYVDTCGDRPRAFCIQDRVASAPFFWKASAPTLSTVLVYMTIAVPNLYKQYTVDEKKACQPSLAPS